jgi:hypothetical protein
VSGYHTLAGAPVDVSAHPSHDDLNALAITALHVESHLVPDFVTAKRRLGIGVPAHRITIHGEDAITLNQSCFGKLAARPWRA